MNWLGWAEVIGGGLATAFGGGAVGVPLIMSGVGNITADKARTAQTTAINQAGTGLTDIYRGTRGDLASIYKTQQANLAPYTSLGASGASLLSRGLGIPVAAPTVTPVADSGGGLAPGAGLLGGPGGGVRPVTAPGVGTFAGGVPFPNAGNGRTTLPPSNAMVTMRAPTGEMEQIPAAQVPYYRAKGAVVVSNG